MADINKTDIVTMIGDLAATMVNQDQLTAVTMPTIPRIVYIDAAFTGNVFPYFSNWASARAALLALTPVPDVTHPAWATRFSAADGTQVSIGGDTVDSLAAMGIILRDGSNGANGTNGRDGTTREVYRAKITAIAQTITSGSLVIDTVYTIVNYHADDDFTNVANMVGGTINTNGCVFIATGTTPTHWAHASALVVAGGGSITQDTIYENNIGDTLLANVGDSTQQGLYTFSPVDAPFSKVPIVVVSSYTNNKSVRINGAPNTSSFSVLTYLFPQLALCSGCIFDLYVEIPA